MNTVIHEGFAKHFNLRQVFWILMVVLGMPAFSQTGAHIPHSEREALIALFQSTRGESWKETEGWLSSETGLSGDSGTECNWAGVECDESGTHVRRLSLSGFGLRGVLSPDLSNLRQLEILDLSFNQIGGEIPQGLFKLRRLTRLDLSHNRLRGSLPLKTASLPNLEMLNLSGNYLGGTLKGIGRLHHLVYVDLSANGFEGPLPATLDHLHRLKGLNVAGNRLTGTLPVEVGKLHSMRELGLAHNNLSGQLPEQIGSLRNLTVLDLSFNKFTGPLPASISRLSGLELFSAAHNGFEGSFTASICHESLTSVDLSANHLRGELPTDMAPCKSLQYFLLANNNIGGELTNANIGALTAVRSLNLAGNHFSGRLPAALGTLTDLSELNLADNEFTGDIASVTWPELSVLHMDRNHVFGSIPPQLFSGSLEELTLSANELKGPVPESLCSSHLLRILDLSHNRLTGPLCSAIGDLEELNVLNLSYNEFDGELPPSIGQLKRLTTLRLSNNRFAGSLPNSANLFVLQILDISFNHFAGEVPPWVGQLRWLRSVNLRNNGFTSGLGEFEGLKNLRHVDLRENKWSESLSQKLIALQSASESLPITVIDPTILLRDTGNKVQQELRTPDTLPESAQNDRLSQEKGTVSGMVIDPAGAPISGIAVVAQSPSITETAWTDARGRYKLSLTPGNYHFTFEAPGFEKQTIEQVKVQAAISQAVNVVLGGTTLSQIEGAVSGMVTDRSGAVISGVTVVATSLGVNAQTQGVTKTAKTDTSGFYELSMPPGKYHLNFEMPGFKKETIEQAVQVAMSQAVNVTLSVSSSTQTVTVTAQAPPTDLGPWWNSWFTRRGAAEESKERILQPHETYSFYLELSSVSKRDQEQGDLSVALGKGLREHLLQLLKDGSLDTQLFVRISVIGRAAALSEGVSPVAEWSQQTGWMSGSGSAGSATLHIDLAKLASNQGGKATVDSSDAMLALRGGAVRFTIDTLSVGCAAIAVSIWDETRKVPLDHLVRILNVGTPTECVPDITQQQATLALFSNISEGIAPDVSLHVFEFKLNGRTHSASFMVLSNPVSPCDSYNWDSDATLSDLVLSNSSFKADLNDARMADGVYSSIGEQIVNAVFPSTHDAVKCGSAEALAALKQVTEQKDARMFARVSDENDRLAIAPLGLLAMFEKEGQRVFAHDIRLLQPIARETLSETGCVSNWTFVLPSELERVLPETLVPPDSLANDARVIRSNKAFVNQFIDSNSDNKVPSGLVLLAHHVDGVLRFSGPGDVLGFNRFDKQLGPGSIAVLSACETTNLTNSTKLVDRLNAKGVDALIAASFEVPVPFGARFAFNFADFVAHNPNQQATLEQAFTAAVSKTVKELTASTSESRARGMGLELVLAGNPNLKICAPGTQ